MSKTKKSGSPKFLLFKLAVTGIWKNKSAYFPYLLISAFSVFVFFIFAAIGQNKMMRNMPHANNLVIMMVVGVVLLCVILAPVLTATHRYLMKQRKKELGLYSILGMEKKHIAVLLFVENVLLYVAMLFLGIVTALVFSNLIFKFLLNIVGIPLDVRFTATLSCYAMTAVYFGIIALDNFFTSVVQVSRLNPVELLSAGRQGEKQPKHVWLTTLVGLLTLGWGYKLSITSVLDGNIFGIFLGAVILVVFGTYCLFTAGSIFFLRLCQKNRRFYYKKENFVTVSGMLYRMKKNAATLSNICIFSTMVIITVICTTSLFFGQAGAVQAVFPKDVVISYMGTELNQREATEAELERLAKEHGVTVQGRMWLPYTRFPADFRDGSITKRNEDDEWQFYRTVYALHVSEFNEAEQTDYTLNENEVLLYSTAKDWGVTELNFFGTPYKVKKELGAQDVTFKVKDERNYARDEWFIIVPDSVNLKKLLEELGHTPQDFMYGTLRFDLEGEQEDCEAVFTELSKWASHNEEFSSWRIENIYNWEKDMRFMNGGLLFLGIFFGIVFFVCLVMMMYYKQVSEGYEDKKNFEIMQKVGMSDKEVRSTIRRQILTVFFLPLAAALLHTAAALNIVMNLMGSLHVYNNAIILLCTLGTALVFAVFYGASYVLTARAYYRIVQGEA